ncbi:fatty acid desaturase [bacterium]|nr:fatty acid desaturase [bacterium]
MQKLKTFLSRYNLVTAPFFIILSLAAVTLTPWHIYMHGLAWQNIALFLFMLCATLMSITCGYHRLFAHRSYEASPVLKFFYLVFGACAFQQSCIQWASEHRVHHQFVDQEKDPYSIQEGFWWAHIGWILSSKKANAARPQDLLNDPLVMWQEKYWKWIGGLVGGLMPALIAHFLWNDFLGGFIYGGVLRLFLAHHITFAINSLAHTLGKQNYTDTNSAKDSWITAIFTFGEGYHNFHHWYARDYRNGIKAYHWDPSKWFIKSMNWLGLTWNLKQASQEAILQARLKMQKKRLEQHQPLSEKAELLFDEACQKIEQLKLKKQELSQLAEQKKAAFMNSLDLQQQEFQQSFKQTQAAFYKQLREKKASLVHSIDQQQLELKHSIKQTKKALQKQLKEWSKVAKPA